MTRSVIPEESVFTNAAAAWGAASDDGSTSVGGALVGSMKTARDEAEEAEVATTSSIWGPQGYLSNNVNIMNTYQTYQDQLVTLAQAASKELKDTSGIITEICAHYVATEQINTELAGRPL